MIMRSIRERKLVRVIHTIIFATTLCTVATSCKNEVDDVFGEQSSIREAKAESQARQTLAAATNGWVMAFYGNTEYGGYNVLCRFTDDGQVTVANEKFGTDTTAVSHYKLEQSSGLILSFDEYCELIHYFSDPVNPDGYGYGTAEGFGGDLEFRIIKCSADSVVLSGKKHGTRVVMTPMPASTAWSDYLSQVNTVATAMQGGNYFMVAGTDSLKLKGSRQNRAFTYTTTNDEGESYTYTVPFIVTPGGLTFYTPMDFAGQQVGGFIYQESAQQYVQADGGSVTLCRAVSPLNEQLVEGTWYITKDGLGDFATQRWNIFVSRLQNNFNLEVFFATFGTLFSDFGLSVGLIDATEPDGYYLCECHFDYELIGDNEITLWFNGEFDNYGNGEYIYPSNMGALNFAVQPFGNETTTRTFTIEADNPNSPTWLRLTDQNQPNNVITLMADESYFPFGQ